MVMKAVSKDDDKLVEFEVQTTSVKIKFFGCRILVNNYIFVFVNIITANASFCFCNKEPH